MSILKNNKISGFAYALIYKRDGFTLIEVIVGIALLTTIGGLISLLFLRLSDYQLFFTKKFEAQQEIQQTIPFIVSEIRSMSPSSAGSYPIASASTSSIIFYSNVDGDNLIEQIRYFLDGDILKKGTVKPSGNPLSYNSANETTAEMIHNILATSTPIFSYYDENYTGSENPMNQPAIVSNIKIIAVQLMIQNNASQTPIIIKVQAMPRNLRNNL